VSLEGGAVSTIGDNRGRSARLWLLEAAAVLIVLSMSLIIFFRAIVASGFTTYFGDSYDGLIEISVLQHWHNVAAFGNQMSVTEYFYPYKDSIGYNDTYLIPGLFFTLGRLFGADPFRAALVSHVAMKAIGFLGMYALLRKGVGIRLAIALAGAAIFTTANASLLHMHHAQLLSAGFLPWLALLLLMFGKALIAQNHRRVVMTGCGFAVLFGLTALNSFYAAWFFAFFTMLATLVGLAVIGAANRRQWFFSICSCRTPLALVFVAAVVSMAPLILVYLPKIADGAHHDWATDTARFLIAPSSLINVGVGNLVWGQALNEAMRGLTGHPMAGGEARFGFPLGLLVTAVMGTIWAARRRPIMPLPFALGFALEIAIILMLKSPGDYSLWRLIYEIFPGANAIRVVSRFLLFAVTPVVVIVCSWLDGARLPKWALIAIVVFLLIEEIQLAPPLMLNRARELAMLDAAGAPPAECRAFFVVSARSDIDSARSEARDISRAWNGEPATMLFDNYRHNVDAMFIASYRNVPTINGFSTFNPPDWEFSHSDAPDYLERIARYARRHGLTALCGLDVRRRPRWFHFDLRRRPTEIRR